MNHISLEEHAIKRLVFVVFIDALFSILTIACSRGSSIDTSLFTVEEIDGVRHMHDQVPQMGDAPGVEIELKKQ